VCISEQNGMQKGHSRAPGAGVQVVDVVTAAGLEPAAFSEGFKPKTDALAIAPGGRQNFQRNRTFKPDIRRDMRGRGLRTFGNRDGLDIQCCIVLFTLSDTVLRCPG
jgi:hypothetical protein